MTAPNEQLIAFYRNARDFVNEKYPGDVEFMIERGSRDKNALTDNEFIREYAWVIMASGFKEKVLRGKWQAITDAFHNWDAWMIADDVNLELACNALNRPDKYNAIISLAKVMRRDKKFMPRLRKALIDGNVDWLQKNMKFIADVTKYHLAKNLGVQVAKPDVHMERLSAHFGYGGDVQKMCEYIKGIHSDYIGVIDVVLWRYMASGSPVLPEIVEVPAEEETPNAEDAKDAKDAEADLRDPKLPEPLSEDTVPSPEEPQA